MSVRPLRVLLVAENASTRLGGEAILPYHYFRILLKRDIDVHLIVHERVRDELEELFPNHLDRFHFVSDQLLQKIFFRLGRLLPRRVDEATLVTLTQLLTQSAQRRIVRSLCNESTVVHQPIPVSPRAPSLLYDLGAPLICGPLNGGMEYPPAFRKAESWLTRVVVAAVRSSNNFVNTVFPGKTKAAVVLVANERTRKALPRNIRGEVLVLPENGIDVSQWKQQQSTTETIQIKFVFIGRLVEQKALDIIIQALVRLPGATLDVVGDGPMREPWRLLTVTSGVANRVNFRGWLSQHAAAEVLCDAQALVLPSIYESGGAVVLEAMAASKPVIATKWGGPVDYLDDSCGILIPPASRAALVAGFVEAMALLSSSPDLGRAKGEAGRARVIKHFDWEKKADDIVDIYSDVLTRRSAQ